MNTEELFPIKGYEGKYAVTKSGKVWSYPSRTRKQGFFMKYFIQNQGYYEVMFMKDKKRQHFRINRLVAQTFIPNPDNKPQVNHINGIKTDNRVENLEWCTFNENMKHAQQKGLTARGHKQWSSKLENHQALEIIELIKAGNIKLTEIAKTYNVTIQSISKIKHRRSWGWLW